MSLHGWRKKLFESGQYMNSCILKGRNLSCPIWVRDGLRASPARSPARGKGCQRQPETAPAQGP
ncbi:unnamed protein product [Prunus armeniaca]